MPTYEYECNACGNTFDAFQNITADHLKNCPKCSGKVRRLISGGAGIIFKGSGFYHTDYKNKKKEQSCPLKDSKPACGSCNANKKE